MMHLFFPCCALLHHILFVSCGPTCLFGLVNENDFPVFFSDSIFPDFSLRVNPARNIAFKDSFSVFDGLTYTFCVILISVESDFFAFAFLTFLPNDKDLKAEKATRFSLQLYRLTCCGPSEMLFASDLNVFLCFSSEGVFTFPSSSRSFLVLRLLIIVLIIAAFFLRVARNGAFTISVSRSVEALFICPSP